MTSRTVHPMKSMGYGRIRVRPLTHVRRLLRAELSNKIRFLGASKQLGVKPPYYVWGGHPQGLASHPIRLGQARAPP